jgi:hypothetical protein
MASPELVSATPYLLSLLIEHYRGLTGICRARSKLFVIGPAAQNLIDGTLPIAL